MTASVPLRYRRALHKARRNSKNPTTTLVDLDDLAATERRVLAEIDAAPPAPAPAKRERQTLRERWQPKPVRRAWMEDPGAELRWLFLEAVPNEVSHHWWRADWYAADVGRAVGRGVRRSVVGGWEWVRMPRHRQVLSRLVELGDDDRFARLSRRYAERTRNRALAALGIVGGVLAVLALLWTWNRGGAVLVTVTALALVGRTPDTPATPRPDNRPAKLADPRPSPDLVYQAFDLAGIEGVICEIAPHRVGSGWETIVRIPPGRQTFDDAVKFHGAIAGNLGVTVECLTLTPVRGQGGSTKHVRVWFARTDPMAGDPPPHPLLNTRTPADLWNEGLPIGLDVRGTVARIAVVDTPFIAVVGQPGAGKTFLFFGMAVGIAADPLWDLDAWAFKPSGTFAPVEPLIRACGGTYDYGADRATFDRFYRYLVGLKRELAERNAVLDGLPLDDNPNDRVERTVAARPGSPLRPRTVMVDEIITAIEGDNRILPELEELARTARSQHIVFVLGAQFADSDTFKNLQKLLGARIVLSVARHHDTEMALAGDHIPGLTDAHRIPLTAKATAFAAGAIEDPEIGRRPAFKIRTFSIDRSRLAEHVTHCLATHRAQDAPVVRLVKDDPVRAETLALLEPGENVCDVRTLAERGGLDPDQLTKRLEDDGLVLRPSSRHGGRKSIRRDQLTERG